MRRRSSRSPRGLGRRRRERRFGRSVAIVAISLRARASSSGVISAKSLWRSVSSKLKPPVSSSPASGGCSPSACVPAGTARSACWGMSERRRSSSRTGAPRNHAANARSNVSRSSARETSVVRSVQ